MRSLTGSTDVATRKLYLEDRLVKTLKKKHVHSAEEINRMDLDQLCRVTTLGRISGRLIFKRLDAYFDPTRRLRHPPTVRTLLAQGPRRLLSTSDAMLNQALGGGLKPGVTEIYGSSGTGKTQLAMQLSIVAALPKVHGGLNGGIVWISTQGGRFPIKRLYEIAEERGLPEYLIRPIMDRIRICHIGNVESLDELIRFKLEPAVQQHRVCLIVLDTVTALFRGDETAAAWDYFTFRSRLSEVGLQLQKIAGKHECVVLCINQVKDDFNATTPSVLPALPDFWTRFLNMRVQLSRSPAQMDTTERTLEVMFGVQRARCHYDICSNGIEGKHVEMIGPLGGPATL
ncbi:DNA repair protein xrcc3 [Thoreauomyces humboldtii]|nr:DNA repair protein xrcc3 [Thoreauomyces humboldtii]